MSKSGEADAHLIQKPDPVYEWVTVCDTCGDVGDEDKLAFCNKCDDGAQHTYCMRVKLDKVPASWTCEECASREVAQIEAVLLSQGHLMPEFYYSWIGKFQIHGSEGIARTCDGFQAHLSTHASIKVLDAVCRLPDVIRLEELPRSSIWPSLFMSAQVTENNIGLYFFAKDVNSYNTYYRGLMSNLTKNDLALKGNLDGVELLIFPSNILHMEIRCWNHLLFFWGVFKERKANNSPNSNTSILNAQKSESRYNKKYRPLNMNEYLEDVDEEVGVAETLVCDNKDGTATGNAKHSSGAIGIEDIVMGPSTLHSVAPAKIEELPDWEAAETLILLSKENILNA